MRLLEKIGDFLNTRRELSLLDGSRSGDLYWNILFWLNFMNLPSFFVQPQYCEEAMNFSVVYLRQYSVSQGKYLLIF